MDRSTKYFQKAQIRTASQNLFRLGESMEEIFDLYGDTVGELREGGVEDVHRLYERLGFSLFAKVLPVAHEFYQEMSEGGRAEADRRMERAMDNPRT